MGAEGTGTPYLGVCQAGRMITREEALWNAPCDNEATRALVQVEEETGEEIRIPLCYDPHMKALKDSGVAFVEQP